MTMREEEFRIRLRRAIGEPPPVVRPNLTRPQQSSAGSRNWFAGAVGTVFAALAVMALLASRGVLQVPILSSNPGSTSQGTAGGPVDRATLEARPMQLSQLASGQQCPTGKPVRLAVRTSSGKWPNYGFGSRPVYLSGQTAFYAGGDQVVVLLIDPKYTGALLVRSNRLDGTGSLSLREIGSSSSTTEVWLPKTSSPPDWGTWEAFMAVDVPGCYAVQFDGGSFTESVVIRVLPGPPPPA